MIRNRLITSLAASALVAGALVLTTPSATTAASTRASSSDDRVPNHYLIDLKPGVNAKKYAKKIAAQYGGKATMTYDAVLGGFAFEGPDKAARRLASDKRVEGVEQDRVVHATDAPPTNVNHLNRNKVPEAYAAGYLGAGVTIAVLDTGVDASHEVFQAHSNILPGKSCAGGGAPTDKNGHGTATASNAVGRIGTAHEAKVIPIKVFPGGGLSTTWSRVVCGLNYVRQHSAEIDIVNMSIAGSGSGALKKAVQRVVQAGIVVVAAAGNNGAGTQAPAKYPGVIAASALAGGDSIASFSSTGEIAAPGVSIHSADKNGGFSDRSGTSRSAPEVAGAAAIVLALDPTANVLDALQAGGTCPNGSVNGKPGTCAGQWQGDDAHAEPAINAYCTGVYVDPVRSDIPACGF